MAFPAPTANAVHIEGDTRYVVRDGRWERYIQPEVAAHGPVDIAGIATGLDGSDWAWIHSKGKQHRANYLIRYKAAFTPDTDSNPLFGVWSDRDAKWLNPKTEMDRWDGMVHWGGGGTSSNDYNSGSFDNNGFLLNLTDNSTRLCKAGRLQFVEVTITRLGPSHSMMSIHMSQTVRDGPFFVQSLARARIQRPIEDVGSVFIKVSAGNFKWGHGSVEVF